VSESGLFALRSPEVYDGHTILRSNKDHEF
jgi:hypothetical protein